MRFIALRRRRYIISRLQVRLLLHLLLYGALFLGGIALFVFLPVALEMSDPESSEQQQAKASAAFLALDASVWPAVGTLLVVIGGHAVLLTHRVVGPLYRFRQVMRDVARGDLSIRAKIRDKDLLHDEAEVLNELLEAFESRTHGVVRELEHLREALAALDEADEGKALLAERARLREALVRLEARLPAIPEVSVESASAMEAERVEPPAALPSTTTSRLGDRRGADRA